VAVVTCPFCDWSGPVLADYGDVLIIEPLHPVVPGHLLAVATDHVTDALQAPSVTGQVAEAAADYAANRSRIEACNLITSVGAVATQSVFHLHLHIVPRTAGDGLRLPWSEATP
jgi:histidine triad (HIT) family protein